MNKISFRVDGIPRPGGSKRAFFNKATGRAIVVEDCKRNKDWRTAVAWAARAVYTGPPLRCALNVTFAFSFERPKGHFGSGKNIDKLKCSAPSYHTIKPDVTKLVRSTEDALTGILWHDDSQIVIQTASKKYESRPGAIITVIYEDTNDQA